MGNQAATLATQDRRKITRLLDELLTQVTDLRAVMYGHTEQDDLDANKHDYLIDHFTDLHTITSNIMSRMDRWGAFLEVIDDH